MNNIARGVLITILSLVLAGFGLCGAVGTFSGLAGLYSSSANGEAKHFAPLVLTCGLIGLAIAAVCLFVVAKLWRKRPPGAG